MNASSNRRTFIKAVAATSAGLTLANCAPAADEPKPTRKTRLGFDNFSLRALKWNASQLIDYAASLKLDSLFLTDLDVYENFQESYLQAGFDQVPAIYGTMASYLTQGLGLSQATIDALHDRLVV